MDNTNQINALNTLSQFDKTYEYVNSQKKYKQLFDNYLETNRAALDTFDSGYMSLDESAAKELVEAAADSMIVIEKQKIEKAHFWNRSTLLFVDAMTRVMFLIPVLISYGKPSAAELADSYAEKWNESFPKNKIQKADFESINSGFSKGGLAGLFKLK